MPGIIVADGGEDYAYPEDAAEEEVLERVDDNNNNGNGNDNAANLHPPPLGVDSPGRMELTEYERNLALNIKEAIASTPEVDPVTDFMCVQLALIDGDDTERAIERAHHLQCLREEYRILDTVEDGKRCFMDYFALFPELLLCFTYIPEGGNYTMIYDLQKFSDSEIRSDERLRAFIGGSYYTCVALCPDFEAIRSGFIMVVECEGYDWKRNMDIKTFKKVWSEIATVYPFWFKKLKYMNAANAMIILVNMVKPFIPTYLRRKIEFGSQCDQRLDSLYMVPSVEAANLRTLTRLKETFDRRYENERTFRL